ncbi:3-oxoacyl-[acyl-carrier-protein] synthase-3 [Kineococcus xinjiangensis]|uniref:3-oxoacyl-[acyl-carrier-protein] synthase-3 n=1 Tax=Kineococcus xinjiangensis TaxID=512762 RepID=A0A2S6IJ93_9ACTN|nr:beta-ketoacyl-ACP synthase 3 [Kineococcus xinjiangensis]PPK94255.1 3-oxoacyl-[acyl-carrier-protein] synthase-3 [Kineococcus xinjiangensis]
MRGFGERGSQVLGLGHHQPPQVLTNEDLSARVDTSDEWIRTRTGISTRHVAGDGDTVASMGAAAARMALAEAGTDPQRVSMVVLATMTDEDRSPNSAGRVAAELGLAGPAVLDVNTACSGFEYALGIADQAVRAGTADHVLVIGSEKMTAVTDWSDRSTCVLTGDGAGALLIGPSEPALLSSVVWGSVPHLLEAVRVEGTPSRFAQEGRSVYRWAITEAATHAEHVLKAAGMTAADLGVLAFHQANLRIVEPLARALGAENAVVITDVTESGNTSAASVPLGLSKAWHRGELPAGAPALLFGFGGGFTYAGLVAHLPDQLPG